MIDCHVHSSFSGDSEMPADVALDEAHKRGLKGVAFTDHLDYDYPGYDDFFMIDFETYSDYIDKLKYENKSRIKIIKGIEVGIQPHVIEDTLKVVQTHDFDYVLASVHIIDGMDPYKREYYSEKTKIQAYSRYLNELLFTVTNFEDFDILGHIDYIIRYAGYVDRTLRYNEHPELFDTLFRELIERDKGFEINTGSYRENISGPSVPEFDVDILKRYKELGGENICLSSDSHYADYLGYKFDYFKDMLSDVGFKYTVNFEKRKPVYTKI
jgi:histidinol-phosphatase (PHP family)